MYPFEVTDRAFLDRLSLGNGQQQGILLLSEHCHPSQ